MKNLLLSVLMLLLPGCSVHQFWNGDTKPGLTYISIDANGNTTSNAKAIGYAEDFFTKLIKETSEKEEYDETDKESITTLVQELNDLSKRNTLFIWGANYNGSMINETGQMCLQAASYARSTESSLDISASLLNVINGISLVDPKDKLLALKIAETITSLQTNSQQSTYLSAGLFGICILQANGALKEEDTYKAVSELISASQLKSGSEETKPEDSDTTQDKPDKP